MVKHVQAYKLGFERFADYYYQPKHGLPEDRRVNFTNWDVLVVPEEATRVAALRAGETDIAPISLASRNQGGGRRCTRSVWPGGRLFPDQAAWMLGA